MVKKLRLPNGSKAWNDRQLRLSGELTIDNEEKNIRLHDGMTPGGVIVGGGEGSIIFDSGITVLGALADVSGLPDANEFSEGDTFVIDSHFHTVVNNEWLDIGDIRGPGGLSAYDIAQVEGFLGSQLDWLESLRGSGGTDGTWTQAGLYGGGAKGRSSNNNFGAVNGGNGALRLMWGVGRMYPSTNTGNL